MHFGLKGALPRAVLLAVAVAAGPAAPTAGAAITVTDVAVEEGSAAVFRLTTDNPVGETAQVGTKDGSAAAGTDYTGRAPAAVVVPGGSAGTTVSVATTQDGVLEPNETFQLVVDGLTADMTATATIENDEAPPILAVVQPAKEGAGSQVIAAVLALPTTKDVTVDVATADGTAVAGSDFTATAGTMTFRARTQVVQELRVPLLDDGLFEGDETFEARFSNPVNGTLGGPSAPGTITNDDAAPTLSIGGGGVIPEGSDGTTGVRLVLRLSEPSALPAAVAVITERGTATSPADFTAVQAVVPFAAGETAKEVVVAVKADTTHEPDERFRVLAGSLGGAQTPGGQPVGVTVTLLNDDPDVTPPRAAVAAPKLRGTLLSAVVSCGSGEELCAGQVAFFKAGDARAEDRTVRPEKRLGRAVAFRLEGGARRTVRLRLKGSALSVMRRAGRPKVTVYVLAADPSGNQVTLRRSARLRLR